MEEREANGTTEEEETNGSTEADGALASASFE